MHRFTLLLAFVGVLQIVSCDKNESDMDPLTTVTDYSDPNNWQTVESDKQNPVDVFFVYPTMYNGIELSCAVTDEGMRKGVAAVNEVQASVCTGV